MSDRLFWAIIACFVAGCVIGLALLAFAYWAAGTP